MSHKIIWTNHLSSLIRQPRQSNIYYIDNTVKQKDHDIDGLKKNRMNLSKSKIQSLIFTKHFVYAGNSSLKETTLDLLFFRKMDIIS